MNSEPSKARTYRDCPFEAAKIVNELKAQKLTAKEIAERSNIGLDSEGSSVGNIISRLAKIGFLSEEICSFGEKRGLTYDQIDRVLRLSKEIVARLTLREFLELIGLSNVAEIDQSKEPSIERGHLRLVRGNHEAQSGVVGLSNPLPNRVLKSTENSPNESEVLLSTENLDKANEVLKSTFNSNQPPLDDSQSQVLKSTENSREAQSVLKSTEYSPQESEILLSTQKDRPEFEVLKSTFNSNPQSLDGSLVQTSVKNPGFSQKSPIEASVQNLSQPQSLEESFVQAVQTFVQSPVQTYKLNTVCPNSTISVQDLSKLKTSLFYQPAKLGVLKSIRNGEQAVASLLGFFKNPRHLHSLFHHGLALLLLIASYYAVRDSNVELAIPFQLAVDLIFLYLWIYAQPGLLTKLMRGLFTVVVSCSILANPIVNLLDHYKRHEMVAGGHKIADHTVTSDQRNAQINATQKLLDTYTASLAKFESHEHPKQLEYEGERKAYQAWEAEMIERKVYSFPAKSELGREKIGRLKAIESQVKELSLSLPTLIKESQTKLAESRMLKVAEYSEQERLDVFNEFVLSLKSNGLVAALRFLVLLTVIFLAVERKAFLKMSPTKIQHNLP